MQDPNLTTCSSSDCATCGGCESANDRRTITLTMEDDTEVECAILTTFPVKEKKYIALLALDENGQPVNGDVYLYCFDITEEGAPLLSNIESDEEYDQAAEVFNAIVMNAQLQEAVEDTLAE
ncbi:MAG: DUF1292 domain-containing protein [Clostridiales bacterium]|nr:DUF1292 domain-containing protein [Candidatus Blautia equi]